jgi:cation transport ATPase
MCNACSCGSDNAGPEVLESTRAVDTVVLDKTGTVTTGRMVLTDVIAAPGEDTAQILRLAGAVEHASEHPIAQAIAAAAADQTGALPAVEDFTNLEGLGVQGVVANADRTDAVLVGRDPGCSPNGPSTCPPNSRPPRQPPRPAVEPPSRSAGTGKPAA